MRDRAVFVAVLLAAAGMSALLLRSRLDQAALDPPEDRGSPAGSSLPVATSTSAIDPSAAAAPSASSVAPLAPLVQEPPPPAYVRVNPASQGACPDGMVLVDGVYCPFVGHRCSSFLNEPGDVCKTYAPDVLCEGRLQLRRYCIDVYEYPNSRGVRPAMMVEIDEARRACALEGKRLCTVEEWEFACEGTQMWPYPYGVERDSEACNIDKPIASPTPADLADPRATADAVERFDGRALSGEMPRCISPFGARDMTGNVDEWVEDTTAKLEERPVTFAVKGGAWGQGRARCRPIAAPPPASLRAFGVGFRCCADARGSERPMSVAPSGVSVPRRRAMEKPDR
jgi:sulfatase modifying factor 1